MGLAFLFDSDVRNDHPRLERLFEQAKQDFWNESTVIDWSRDFLLPLHQLAHLGLPTQAPLLAPARAPPQLALLGDSPGAREASDYPDPPSQFG